MTKQLMDVVYYKNEKYYLKIWSDGLKLSIPLDFGMKTESTDGKCDIRDIALVAMRFGSEAGDGLYDVRADITGPEYLVRDGVIDIRDIALVAKHFGEEY